MMDAGSLQRYLHERIPLSKAMGVNVLEATGNGVILSATLSPNRNHRGSVFGGSASAVAILSAWSLLHLRLTRERLHPRIVIQRSTMTFEHPILHAFTASSIDPDPQAWRRFMNTLERKYRARVTVRSVLHCRNQIVGGFEGDFVAFHSNTV